MKKLMALFTLIFILTAQTNNHRTIVVTLVDDTNQPVVGQPLQLEILVPVSRQSCQTDTAGNCTFFVQSDRELVQGVLMIPGRGNRSLTFKGERLELALQFTPEGFLSIPTDYLPTPTPEVQPSFTPEPSPTSSPSETVTSTPAVVPPVESTATLEATATPQVLVTTPLVTPSPNSALSTQHFLELWPLFLVALVLLTLTVAGFLTYITWSK